MKSKGAKLYLVPWNTFYNISSGREENRFQSGREILYFIWFLKFICIFLHKEKSESMNAKMLIIVTSGYDLM